MLSTFPKGGRLLRTVEDAGPYNVKSKTHRVSPTTTLCDLLFFSTDIVGIFLCIFIIAYMERYVNNYGSYKP